MVFFSRWNVGFVVVILWSLVRAITSIFGQWLRLSYLIDLFIFLNISLSKAFLMALLLSFSGAECAQLQASLANCWRQYKAITLSGLCQSLLHCGCHCTAVRQWKMPAAPCNNMLRNVVSKIRNNNLAGKLPLNNYKRKRPAAPCNNMLRIFSLSPKVETIIQLL